MTAVRRAEKLLSTGEVAKLSGFSSSAVLRWIRAGKLPAYSSPGRQYRVHPRELLGFLKANGMRIPAELADRGPRRILVIDADRGLRQTVARLLEGSGFAGEAVAVDGGVAGCMKMAELRPHLVIVDVLVPDVDCAALCSCLEAVEGFEQTKVLLVGGADDDERLLAALAAGAEGWIRRPFQPDRLLAKMAEIRDGPLPQHAGA